MDRRRALAVFVNSVVALIGAGLSAVLGAFAFRPPAAGGGRWLKAAALTDLAPDRPVPRVLSYPRVDGWYREQARRTVFLVWDGDRTVHALSGTCTHLGCHVRWDAASATFRCPCHGGVFDAGGNVVEGPPPRPLDRLETRVEAASGDVLVRL